MFENNTRGISVILQEDLRIFNDFVDSGGHLGGSLGPPPPSPLGDPWGIPGGSPGGSPGDPRRSPADPRRPQETPRRPPGYPQILKFICFERVLDNIELAPHKLLEFSFLNPHDRATVPRSPILLHYITSPTTRRLLPLNTRRMNYV